MSMMKDKEYTMTVIVKKVSSESVVKAFDKKEKMITSIITKLMQENTEKVEMLFLSSGCNALIREQLLMRYVWKC